ncbi:MAG TPA: hypothetical protein VGC58_02800 [Candidatus Paceibacterota bacterium]
MKYISMVMFGLGFAITASISVIILGTNASEKISISEFSLPLSVVADLFLGSIAASLIDRQK